MQTVQPNPTRMYGRVLAACVATIAFAAFAHAQGVEYVREHYAKTEHLVPMRDGVKLFTSVYAPKESSQRWPILLCRTPYGVGPYGDTDVRTSLGPSELFARDGFIFAYQDVRGRWNSEGEFVDMRPQDPDKRTSAEIDESSDAFDTIDWLVKHVPNNNGKVGTWGISYPGFYAAASVIDAHPALVAASPQAPIADWFVGDDFHHNGAFYLPHAFNFYASFGRARPTPTTKIDSLSFDHGTLDGYRFFLELGPLANANARHFHGEIAFWNQLMEHDTYDEFWQVRNLRPHLKNVRPAVLTVGGWFDAEDLFGALSTYRSIEAQSPGADNALVMGPWVHGGWSRTDGDALGDVRFGAKNSLSYRSEIEFPFFRHHLKGAEDPKLPEASIFETGANRWRRFETWPPKGTATRAIYLAPRGGIAFEAPGDDGAELFDEYVSDPAHPVPYIAGIANGMTKEHMVDDQRFATRRADVLVYQSEPLASDLTLAGPIVASLFVSTSGTDSDWVVKLIDVYPENTPDPTAVPPTSGTPPKYTRMGGYAQLVRGECMRGKFRNGFEHPEPFEPGVPAKVEWTLPDVCHTFLAGHRIMLQVQSTWFPLVDRNPQTFCRIPQASASDFVKATERVYFSKSRPSCVRFTVLP